MSTYNCILKYEFHFVISKVYYFDFACFIAQKSFPNICSFKSAKHGKVLKRRFSQDTRNKTKTRCFERSDA